MAGVEMVWQIEGMRQLELKLDKMAKAYLMHRAEIRHINETAGRMFERAMKRKIQSANKDIKITRGIGNKPTIIKRGTYKRSIGTWLVNEDGNAYFAGPRTGRKVGKNSDAWFAYIVESDQQYIDGNNRNVEVIEKTIKSRTRNIEAWRMRQLMAYQNKVNAEMRRTK